MTVRKLTPVTGCERTNIYIVYDKINPANKELNLLGLMSDFSAGAQMYWKMIICHLGYQHSISACTESNRTGTWSGKKVVFGASLVFVDWFIYPR